MLNKRLWMWKRRWRKEETLKKEDEDWLPRRSSFSYRRASHSWKKTFKGLRWYRNIMTINLLFFRWMHDVCRMKTPFFRGSFISYCIWICMVLQHRHQLKWCLLQALQWCTFKKYHQSWRYHHYMQNVNWVMEWVIPLRLIRLVVHLRC